MSCTSPCRKAERGGWCKRSSRGKYAVFRYQGPYENLRAVYDTIYAKWIPEKGYKLGDTPGFEKYLNHPDHTEPENLITEIYIPVQ